MKNRVINIAVVAEIALALKELKDQVIFVGGSVVSLYADDSAAHVHPLVIEQRQSILFDKLNKILA